MRKMEAQVTLTLRTERMRSFKLSVGQARESRKNIGGHLVEEERNGQKEHQSLGERGKCAGWRSSSLHSPPRHCSCANSYSLDTCALGYSSEQGRQNPLLSSSLDFGDGDRK